MSDDRPTTLAEVVERLDGVSGGLTFTGPDGDRPIGFSELRLTARRLGRRLLGLGLRPGDRVLTILPHQHEFVQAYVGSVVAGVVPVPLYPPFMLGQLDAYIDGIKRVLEVTDASAIVSSPELHDFLARTGTEVPFVPFEELAGPGPEGELPGVAPDDVAFLQFTSGSTAAPKGVVVTHRALLANATTASSWLGIDPKIDRGVSWLPLYHDMGLIGHLVVPLLTQTSNWFLPPLEFARRPQAWGELVSSVGGTIGFAPNFGYALLAKRAKDEEVARWDFSTWRVAGCGAEPIDAAGLRRFAERFAPCGFRPEALSPAYGMAEATLAMALTPAGRGMRTLPVAADALRAEGVARPPAAGDAELEAVSCGPALPDHELRVLGPDGAELPDGTEGEIAFRGPSVTAGYYRDPEATAAAYQDGWVHTGDLGFLVDGELYVTGRKKDLMIVKGRNYHPQDLETAVADVPGVRTGNVAAFSCSGPNGEERVVVVAEARAAADPDAVAEEVAARIRARLALAVSDVAVIERDALPKTTSGKIRRSETRARYLDGTLARVEPAPAGQG